MITRTSAKLNFCTKTLQALPGAGKPYSICWVAVEVPPLNRQSAKFCFHKGLVVADDSSAIPSPRKIRNSVLSCTSVPATESFRYAVS
jgi:hypothetical protein